MEDFKDLKSKYDDFLLPIVRIEVGGRNIALDKAGFAISNIIVDLTSGYEASVAEFTIYNCYDMATREYKFDKVKKYILLGSCVKILMGYGTSVSEVFRGFISQVDFVYRQHELPGIEVHAMDVKGIMMANNYAKQIKANSYSEAVDKIFAEGAYEKLQNNGIVDKYNVDATPDKREDNETTDQTVEMVFESDYEFVVKAAKKFNYEFFAERGQVYFRKAKSDTSKLIKLGPDEGFVEIDISYDITGLVGKLEVRNVDPGRGKVVTAKKQFTNKISQGNKAKQLISKQEKIYVDPTAASQRDADYRAQYLLENMSYRFGMLDAVAIGLPVLMPGHFIEVDGFGKAADNTFYLTNVRHTMESQESFRTHIIGRSAKMQ
ncbi:MAG: phage late control D family protein [Butyrivibrio sp.]|nr:phage late control D family protein [Butyrivibrio sp.]